MKNLFIVSVIALAFVYLFLSPASPQEKLEDKLAYKRMLIKNSQGGLVNYGEKLSRLEAEIEELRAEIAK